MSDLLGATSIYDQARRYIVSAGLCAEVERQRCAKFHAFSETDLLRESAWVILCSGFRERIVRASFNYVSLCFCDWESALAIIEADPECRYAAMAVFRNQAKLCAIVEVARFIQNRGFDAYKNEVVNDPLGQLRCLPFIGPVTVLHLAKNLGLDVAKPDRHLNRAAKYFGFPGVDSFCSAVADARGESKNVVDLILWRYFADNPLVLRG